ARVRDLRPVADREVAGRRAGADHAAVRAAHALSARLVVARGAARALLVATSAMIAVIDDARLAAVAHLSVAIGVGALAGQDRARAAHAGRLRGERQRTRQAGGRAAAILRVVDRDAGSTAKLLTAPARSTAGSTVAAD